MTATKWLLSIVLVASQVAAGSAQPPQQTPPKPPPPKPDITDPENYLRPSEPLPPLKLDYFVGNWTFEWDVPEGLFGPGGTITGTETYKPSADGKFIESDVTATGPGGPYTQHIITAYNEAGRVLARDVKDSRGFESFDIGHISTDQGFYLINFDGSTFTYQGKAVRIKTVASLMGPTSCRLRVQMSIDGGPYRSFGNPWWRKQGAGTPGKPGH